MAESGFTLLAMALVLSLYASLVFGLAGIRKSYRFYASARRANQLVFAFIALASVLLLVALLNRDFSLEYVAHYSNRSLDLFYTIAAFWAGQAGSLLFWTLLLAVFTWYYARRAKPTHLLFHPPAQAVLNAFLFFFLYLLVFKSNPFKPLPFGVSDGVGLNPLLQNPAMIFHPPTLYIGFVAYSLPFALAIAALLQRSFSDAWLASLRRWSLFAWMFLTIGNLLGMQWAYVELGWGGYWGWDPVENASLLPWLTGTALLHAILLFERRRVMQTWMLVLVVLTFALTIFGTFVTRSGLIASVHAFGVSTLGPAFLIFLSLILVGSVVLLIARRSSLQSTSSIETWSAKESGFLVGHILMLALAAGVFIGTLMPAISEWLVGRQLTVTEDYYNRIARPLGLAVFFLIGICSLALWRRTALRRFFRNALAPMLLAGAGALISYALAPHGLWAQVGVAVFIFSFSAVLFSLRRPLADRRRMLAHITHIGVLLFFAGILGSSTYYREKTVAAHQGEEIDFPPYRLHYQGMDTINLPDRHIERAVFYLYRADRSLGMFHSEKQRVADFQPVTEVGIRSTLTHDLYLILGSFDASTETANISLLYNPLVIWIWIGGAIMVLGTLGSFFQRHRSGQTQKEAI
ncbi:heme lyase CcmF/NrfE family subunit [candidate division KSB1 bacterium]|nr:heme lyase CcmF/NrfE family subunit [candidate division KSB1 bacterium]